jgi:hypothetical protein
MYQMLCALMAMIGYGAAAGPCQADTTAVTFQSSTYSDFRPLLAREAVAETVTVRAKLDFPEQVRIVIPRLSSFTRLAAIAMPMKVMSRPSCARQVLPP